MANLAEVHTKLGRWIEKITEFDVEFHHRPNTDNMIHVADGMSRLHPTLQSSQVKEKEALSLDPSERKSLRSEIERNPQGRPGEPS
jgi:hypothetical protein